MSRQISRFKEEPFAGSHDFRFYNSETIFCCNCGLMKGRIVFYGEQDGTGRYVSDKNSKCNAPSKNFYVLKVMGMEDWS